jgi:hypothetical protein
LPDTPLAAWAAEFAAGPQYAEEWEEWWEEEGSYEYITTHQGSEMGQQEGHLEFGVLYQPLGQEGGTAFGGVVPLCSTSVHEFCADQAGLAHGVRVRGFRLACTGVAVLAVACGGDDEIQRMAEAEARGPVETPVTQPYEPRLPDPVDLDGVDDFEI